MQNVVDTSADHVFAMEVLEEQIGNCATKEVVDHIAEAWEEENCKAVVRPDEEREPDPKTGRAIYAATYLARKKHFDALRSKKVPLAMAMSLDMARNDLERYARVPMSELIRDTKLSESEDPAQRAQSRNYARRINELRAVLGQEPLDFGKVTAPKADTAPDMDKKISEFLAMPLGDRRRVVHEIVDRVLLGYIMSDDNDREVVAAAQSRLFSLAAPKG